MQEVYNLRNNTTLVKGWQQAEAQDGIYEHPFGLPGTESWWRAIDSGDLPVKMVEDVVIAYEPSGDEHGKPALFTLSDKSTWTAFGERGCLAVYQKGQHVRVHYLTLRPRKSWAKEHKLILKIERDDEI